MTDPARTWFMLNLAGLSGYFQPHQIHFSCGTTDHTLIIREYPLPNNFRQTTTSLLIVFPGEQKIFLLKPDRFYVDKGLLLKCGRHPNHIFDYGLFNDIGEKNWARYSFHLSQWSPTRDVINGSTIFDILKAIHVGLSRL